MGGGDRVKYFSMFSGIGTGEKGIEQAYMTKQIQITWTVDDVKEVCPELSDEQAERVLMIAAQEHNPEIGINFSVLESIAEGLVV